MSRIGFFGKLPSRGDFVRVGLTRAFVQSWDAWIGQVLPAARSALGNGWDEAWRSAPSWRFCQPAGPRGSHRASGVWLPSTDRVGRAFPLVLAVEDAPSRPVLEAFETVGRRAIAEIDSPDTLASRLAGLASEEPSRPEDAFPARWWRETAGGTVDRIDGAVPDLTAFLRMIAT